MWPSFRKLSVFSKQLSTSSASTTLWDLLWKMRLQMQGVVTCPQFSVSFASNQCRIHSKVPYFISTRKYAFASGKVIFNSNVINMNRSCAGKLSTEGLHSARLHLSGISCFTVQPSPPKCSSRSSNQVNITHSSPQNFKNSLIVSH